MASIAHNGDGNVPMPAPEVFNLRKSATIEERYFTGALICLEGHYTDSPPMGPLTREKVVSMISASLEKTHASKEVR